MVRSKKEPERAGEISEKGWCRKISCSIVIVSVWVLILSFQLLSRLLSMQDHNNEWSRTAQAGKHVSHVIQLILYCSLCSGFLID